MTNQANKPAETTVVKPVKTSLTYENKVIEKIVGHALETVDGLLAVSGGFFTDLKNKTFNAEKVTDGVNVEVGTKEVAVDLDIIVEYQKDIPAIAEQIKEVVSREVERMTKLVLVELNVNVVDVKTRAEHVADSITVQDRVEYAAQSASDFASEQAGKARVAFSNGIDTAKETISDATEARVN